VPRKEYTETAGPEIFVKKEDKWLGPYTLLQLQSLEFLTPDTETKIGENGQIIKAGAIPALDHYFKIKDTPLWKMRRICPLCQEWLIVQEYEGLYIWRCAFCNGLLVEKDKLPRIIMRELCAKKRDFLRKLNILPL